MSDQEKTSIRKARMTILKTAGCMKSKWRFSIWHGHRRRSQWNFDAGNGGFCISDCNDYHNVRFSLAAPVALRSVFVSTHQLVRCFASVSEGSHICHERECVNPAHISLETGDENNDRNKCRGGRRSCTHTPPCNPPQSGAPSTDQSTIRFLQTAQVCTECGAEMPSGAALFAHINEHTNDISTTVDVPGGRPCAGCGLVLYSITIIELHMRVYKLTGGCNEIIRRQKLYD